MRKAFKVATVFTGTAAFAAGFAPAAMAATTAETQPRNARAALETSRSHGQGTAEGRGRTCGGS
jgi:hypothetical protein